MQGRRHRDGGRDWGDASPFAGGGPVSPALVQFHTLRGAAVCREISAALVALAFVNRLLGPSPLPRGL